MFVSYLDTDMCKNFSLRRIDFFYYYYSSEVIEYRLSGAIFTT